MKETSDKICYVPGCSNPSSKVTQIASKSTLMELFDNQSENEHPTLTCEEERGYPLCQEHYGVLYRHLNPTHFHKQCKTCNRLLYDLTKTRKCPQPTLVQSFLMQNTEFTGEITADDRVCYACYKSHLVIIKHSNNTNHNTDRELHELIDALKMQVSDTADVHTIDHALSYVAHFSAIFVGEALLKQNALLLPDVYDSFITKLKHVILNAIS